MESNTLTMIFCNIDEYLTREEEQNRRISHTINELFVKQNKGEYTFFEDGHHRKLAITFKLLQK